MFTKIPQPAIMMLREVRLPRHRIAYQWLYNVKINKYAKFDLNIPCGSRVMRIFTN